MRKAINDMNMKVAEGMTGDNRLLNAIKWRISEKNYIELGSWIEKSFLKTIKKSLCNEIMI